MAERIAAVWVENVQMVRTVNGAMSIKILVVMTLRNYMGSRFLICLVQQILEHLCKPLKLFANLASG